MINVMKKALTFLTATLLSAGLWQTSGFSLGT